MNVLHKFLNNYTMEEKLIILKDYIKFKEKGTIGDSLLREATSKISEIVGSGFGNIFSMETVGKEVAVLIACEQNNI